MNPLKTRALTRQQIGQFVDSERGIRAFEDVQADIASQYEAITNASFLTLTTEPGLGAERVLTPSSDFAVTDGGPNSTYAMALSPTGVVAGAYGDASHTISATVDSRGRVSSIASYALNTDNITEGATNLFFTTARARASLSSGTGISYDSTSGVISAGTVLAAYAGGDTPSPFTLGIVDSVDAAAWRTALSLGTAATQNTGTSGANVPLLSGANTWGASQSITGALTTSGNATINGGTLTLGRRGAGLEGGQITFGYGNAVAGDWFADVNSSNDFRIFRVDGGGTVVAASFSQAAGALTLAVPLPAASGGTGLSGYTTGDLLYASSSSALSALADVATGNALISGGVGTAPSWGKIGISTHVSGLGTNVATFLGTPSSANLASAITDETGSGALVFGTSPTLSSPSVAGNLTMTGAAGTYSDTTASATSVASDGTVDFPNFSGQIIVNDTSTGAVGLYLCGGGAVASIGASGTVGGTVAYNAGIAGYRFTNTSGGTRTFSFAAVRTRNTA